MPAAIAPRGLTGSASSIGEPMLEALELRTQDEPVGSAILRELPQLRLGDQPLRILQHDVNPFL